MAPGPPPATLFLTPVGPSTDIGDVDLKHNHVRLKSSIHKERNEKNCRFVNSLLRFMADNRLEASNEKQLF